MDGILLFNKPILWTSHDAVDFLRRCTGQSAIGHAGTLDPMATGLLVLLIGKMTKRSAEYSALDKEYRGSFRLGVRADTLDLEGRILEERADWAADPGQIRAVFSEWTGWRTMQPPAFSAVKSGGRKAYEWARHGIAVETRQREIEISSFHLDALEGPEIYFTLSCSKGTYVRVLCEEVGKALGCGAALSSLVRTRVGPHRLEDALDEKKVSAAARTDWPALLRRSQ